MQDNNNKNHHSSGKSNVSDNTHIDGNLNTRHHSNHSKDHNTPYSTRVANNTRTNRDNKSKEENTSSNYGESSFLPNAVLFNKIAEQYTKPKTLSADDKANLSYKNIPLLKRFLSPRGRILAERFTGLSRSEQRQITKLVKKARMLALLPFVDSSNPHAANNSSGNNNSSPHPSSRSSLPQSSTTRTHSTSTR